MKKSKNSLGYVGSVPGKKDSDRDSDSWYTPEKYITSANRVLGKIGLDPFSSELANGIVNATTFLTESDDALTSSWASKEKTVWMNPPYSRGLMGKSVDTFIDRWNNKEFNSAIILVNNSTDTKWFSNICAIASMICLTNHRIAFTSPDGKNVSGNTRGQAFILVTRRRSRKNKIFREEFSKYGLVMDIQK